MSDREVIARYPRGAGFHNRDLLVRGPASGPRLGRASRGQGQPLDLLGVGPWHGLPLRSRLASALPGYSCKAGGPNRGLVNGADRVAAGAIRLRSGGWGGHRPLGVGRARAVLGSCCGQRRPEVASSVGSSPWLK